MTVTLEELDPALTLTLTGGPTRPAVLEAVDAALTLELEGDPDRPPGTGQWWCRFVDQDGVVLAVEPNADLSAPDLTLSDVESWTVALPADSAAATLLAGKGADLGLVEAQIGRDSRIVAWGPIVDIPDEEPHAPLTVHCRGAGYHLERTPLGVTEARERLDDPNFDDGWTSWSALRTTLVSGLPTIDTADPFDVIRLVSAGTGLPNPPRWNRRMVEMSGHLLGEDDGCQIYQQVPIEAGDEDIVVTVRGAFHVPGGQPYRRTNVNAAVIVGLFRDPVAPSELFIPTTYRVPTWREQATEVQLMDVAEWPDEPIQGRWHDIEATLTVPANSGLWLIHAAWSPPRALTYMSFPSVTFAGPLRATGAGPDLVDQVVDWAQDRTQFGIGHLDRNIAVSKGSALRRSIDRTWHESDHLAAWSAVREICDAGLAECRWRYTSTERWLHVTEPGEGRLIAAAKVLDRPGRRTPGWTNYRRSTEWSRGAALLTVQQQNGGAERNWGVQEGDHTEWHSTEVASAEVPRWMLVEDAVNRADRAALPEVWTFDFEPGSPWVTGEAEPGDRFTVDVELHGVRHYGTVTAVTVRPDPLTDACRVVAWPDPTDWSRT